MYIHFDSYSNFVVHIYCTCMALCHNYSVCGFCFMLMYVQVENLLLDSEGVIKLCDFGSATTQQLNPDSSWTAVQRGLAEDEVSMT